MNDIDSQEMGLHLCVDCRLLQYSIKNKNSQFLRLSDFGLDNKRK